MSWQRTTGYTMPEEHLEGFRDAVARLAMDPMFNAEDGAGRATEEAVG
jgi:hypothetical protein